MNYIVSYIFMFTVGVGFGYIASTDDTAKQLKHGGIVSSKTVYQCKPIDLRKITEKTYEK